MIKNNNVIFNYVCFFMVMFLSIFGMIDKINAEDITAEPYIDITFEEIAKENKGHGTLSVFDNAGTGIYGNNTIEYSVDQNGTYMAWTSNYSNGGGFNLIVDKAIGEDYTIALKFSFDNTGQYSGGWKKIIDFQKNGADADSGLYFYENGKMQFYPEDANGPKIKNNEVVDLLIRRNKETNKFEVYNRIGNESILCYEFTDEEGLSILSSGLGFFHNDDYQSGEYSTGGKVYSVKIWDSWIDVDDAWKAIDKEKDDSISRYVCKKIAGHEATETEAGWKSYYKCKDLTDDSYKYFEDEKCDVEITDLNQWKKEEGSISKSISNSQTIKNPQTGDNIATYVVMSIISLLSLFYLVKK